MRSSTCLLSILLSITTPALVQGESDRGKSPSPNCNPSGPSAVNAGTCAGALSLVPNGNVPFFNSRHSQRSVWHFPGEACQIWIEPASGVTNEVTVGWAYVHVHVQKIFDGCAKGFGGTIGDSEGTTSIIVGVDSNEHLDQ